MISLDRVHRMDAFSGLAKLEDGQVDLIVADPPYNVASHERPTVRNGMFMSTMQAWGAWDVFHPFDYDVFVGRLITEAYRVLKPGGSLYIFTSREMNAVVARQAVSRGFTYRNHVALVKTTPLPSFGKKNWRSALELCVYVTKGKDFTFNFLSQKECVNVFPHPSCRKLTDHPTEKPLGLIERIVRVSSNTGDLVLDPFMGSGTTAVACVRSGRRFIGFERESAYVRMARNRIDKARAAEPAREAA